MQCSVLCVLLLAISEPLLVHAKVVLVVPRQVRRTPTLPRRTPTIYYKKSSSYGANNLPRHAYSPIGRFYNRKPYRPLPYPHGGDDFDQGHETVNHVHLPYGKDISHGLSFGKGYIPYENVKSSSLPFVHEKHTGGYARQQPAVTDYPTTGFTSVGGQEYAVSATYDNPQHVDSFFSDMESAAKNELRDSIKDSANKYYASRSIEKDLTLRNQQALNSALQKDAQTAEGLPKDISQAAYGHATTATAGAQGIVLPAGIPPATIAGNKDGIVLRDTVSLDEYHKRLAELAKAWPNVFTNGGTHGSVNYGVHQPLHASVDRFPSAGGLSVAGGGAGSWITNFAQSKQGYAVREDHAEPAGYDFRTMPVHTVPYQRTPPLGVSVGSASGIHG